MRWDSASPACLQPWPSALVSMLRSSSMQLSASDRTALRPQRRGERGGVAQQFADTGNTAAPGWGAAGGRVVDAVVRSRNENGAGAQYVSRSLRDAYQRYKISSWARAPAGHSAVPPAHL